MTLTRPGRLVPVLLALAACNGDDITGIAEGDPLTEAETAALAEVVAGGLFQTWEGLSNPAPAPARVSGNVQIGNSVECDFGGSIAVSGTLAFDVDDDTGDGTLIFTVTQDHQDCEVESDGDIVFVLNGSPNITSSFTVVSAGSELSFDGGFEGAVEWSTGDKSGRCGLDVDFNLSGDILAETGSATLSGRVCGVTFSHDLDLT